MRLGERLRRARTDGREAREGLEPLATAGFRDLDAGTDWFFGATLLAGVCALLGDEPGDAARGLELIGNAVSTNRALGIDYWAEKTSAGKQALGPTEPELAALSSGREAS